MIPKCTEIQRVEVCNMPSRQRVLCAIVAKRPLSTLISIGIRGRTSGPT